MKKRGLDAIWNRILPKYRIAKYFPTTFSLCPRFITVPTQIDSNGIWNMLKSSTLYIMLHIKMIISNFGWFLSCEAVTGKLLPPVSLCSPVPWHRTLCWLCCAWAQDPVPCWAKGHGTGCHLPQLQNAVSNMFLLCKRCHKILEHLLIWHDSLCDWVKGIMATVFIFKRGADFLISTIL